METKEPGEPNNEDDNLNESSSDNFEQFSPEPEDRPLKGGRGGMRTRKHERFKVERPEPEVLDKYYIHYTGEDLFLRGNEVPDVNSEHLFGNNNPLYVDFGCGRGEYVLNQAQGNPDGNYLGIDYHSRSLYLAVYNAASANVDNLKYIRADINRLFPHFPDESVAGASLLFPAPIVEKKHAKNDITSQQFIKELYRTLQPEAEFIFVSDAEWYAKLKSDLIQHEALFELIDQRSAVEDVASTRYQRLWQDFGIESHRYIFRKPTS